MLIKQHILIGSILPLIALIYLNLAVPVAFAGKGDRVIHRVQSKFESLSTLSVHFQVRFEAADTQDIQYEEGRLFMDGKERFRTEMPRQTILSDGQIIWMYNRQENQVIIRSAKDNADDLLTPSKLLYEYPDKYRVEKLEEVVFSGLSCDLLVMVPREETDPTRRLQVWVDREENLTRKVLLEDLAGNTTTFEFEAFQLGRELPAETFHFIPPEDAEVIDIR